MDSDMQGDGRCDGNPSCELMRDKNEWRKQETPAQYLSRISGKLCTSPSFGSCYGTTPTQPSTFHGNAGAYDDPASTLSSPLPPINYMQVGKFTTIYENNYYIDPIGIRITTQPSLTLAYGSPLTVGSDGRTIFSAQSANFAARISATSKRFTGFGINGLDQVNDQFTRFSGISLAPDELNITLNNGAVARIPGTGISVSVNSPTTVGIRYNPYTLGSIALASAVGSLMFAREAYLEELGKPSGAPVGLPQVIH